MLENEKFLARLIAVLRSIDPKTPLPRKLEPELRARMKKVPFSKKLLELVAQDDVPDMAFFLIAGFILVYYIDEFGEIRVTRIYDRDTIIALDAFMSQVKSAFYIIATREAVILSITHADMLEIYKDIPEVQELALKTAASYEKLERKRDELMNRSNREKILEFYNDKKELLPPKKSPLQDKYIASYLRIKLDTFRKTRAALRKEGLLKW
ncbi:hypothetical protein [Pedobacter heparinus]|uniref:Crp/Fnr family transcriptional regulator n=1 Tax=Pedobacter heparinus TaxID=984 RepID=UPI00292E110C|nr:hypothetical protein [Pedobacter heparinus]